MPLELRTIYQVQLHSGVGFDAAAAIADYLAGPAVVGSRHRKELPGHILLVSALEISVIPDWVGLPPDLTAILGSREQGGKLRE